MTKLLLSLSLIAAVAVVPVFAQENGPQEILAKHLKTSRDFTVKVAEAMPAADYGFKLTPPQMSFGEQLVHLAQSLDYFIATLQGEKANPAKVDPTNKEAVIAFIKAQYDKAIAEASKITPEQLHKTYQGEEGSQTGVELLLGMFDHSTHHRASAEMYLRAKGIKPPEYEY